MPAKQALNAIDSKDKFCFRQNIAHIIKPNTTAK